MPLRTQQGDQQNRGLLGTPQVSSSQVRSLQGSYRVLTFNNANLQTYIPKKTTEQLIYLLFELDDACSFHVGDFDSHTYFALGSPKPSFSFTGSLPGGVAFVDNNDGSFTLSGTPITGSGETYSITVTAANGLLAESSIDVIVFETPSLSLLTGSPNFFNLEPGSVTYKALGYPAPLFSLTGELPVGVSYGTDGPGELVGQGILKLYK
jgi:hypothetical protein